MPNSSPLYLRMKQALQWLKQKRGLLNKDIAEKMGMTNVAFSNGMKRIQLKNDEDFVIKFYQATGEIFSLDWLLNGTGDKFASAENLQEQQEPQQSASLDLSTYINALLAKSDETIASLKRELDAKDEIIQSKDDRIADLTKLAEERLARIAELRRIIEANNINISAYPFPFGAAEGNKNKRKQI